MATCHVHWLRDGRLRVYVPVEHFEDLALGESLRFSVGLLIYEALVNEYCFTSVAGG